MKTLLQFPNLKELILEAQMYPKGAKVLTSHPTLEAILCVKLLSYEVVQTMADSRLAAQLTALDFEDTRRNQLASPVIAQIAKFVNLTRLGMRRVDTLDHTAMMGLAWLSCFLVLHVPARMRRSCRPLPKDPFAKSVLRNDARWKYYLTGMI
jgi:hypothetical protein